MIYEYSNTGVPALRAVGCSALRLFGSSFAPLRTATQVLHSLTRGLILFIRNKFYDRFDKFLIVFFRKFSDFSTKTKFIYGTYKMDYRN